MVGRGDEDELLMADDLGPQPLYRTAGQEQTQIDIAVPNVLDRVFKRTDIGDDLDAGMHTRKFGKGFGQQVVGEETLRGK